MRTVTLILVGRDGEIHGALDDFDVSTPWWQEVREIAAHAGAQVLRLLHGDRPAPPGGHVTYLAQTDDPGPVKPVGIELRPNPKRLPYAEPGGPTATLAWAAEVIDYEKAHQKRTWNLSAIWQLDEKAWIKQVPPFFAHEPAAIRMVDEVSPGLVPPLIADGPDGRMLLGHIPGEDGYGAEPEICDRIAAAFHPVQEHFARGTSWPSGIPDHRRLDLEFARPFYATIPGLQDLIEDLPRRLKPISECGLPDTLVHGDLHPGNVRIGPNGLTIMDWGDCVIGHPAYDILRLTEDEKVVDRWAGRWKQTVPGSDPLRAVQLIRPVAALRQAAVYAGFLAAIEPSEHPYHAADVPERLAAAVAAASARRS